MKHIEVFKIKRKITIKVKEATKHFIGTVTIKARTIVKTKDYNTLNVIDKEALKNEEIALS